MPYHIQVKHDKMQLISYGNIGIALLEGRTVLLPYILGEDLMSLGGVGGGRPFHKGG